MTRCPACQAINDATELVRHVRSGIEIVHCPDCGRCLGYYNQRTR